MEEQPHKPIIPFTPVPRRARRDGWTPERQIAFVEALTEGCTFIEACRRVGMSESSAHALRRGPRGRAFREACEAAIDYSTHLLEQEALSRSRHGVPRPIFYKGEQVGEWRHFDERLTMFLLRTRRKERFGRWVELTPPVVDEEGFTEPNAAIRLDGGIEGIIDWADRDWIYECDNEGEANGSECEA